MRRAQIDVMGQRAGVLEESAPGRYRFRYDDAYSGPPVSLSLPVSKREFVFEVFPPFFEGLLPEGAMLEGLLRQCKIDRTDLFGQLLAVGGDTVGAVTVTGEDPA
jgi:serine/threonine-protein kinase HipA